MFKQILFITIFLSLFSFGIFGAFSSSQSTIIQPLFSNLTFNMTILNTSYQVINCKTVFAETQVNSIISIIPNLSYLSSNLTTLTQSDAQLSSYANAGEYVIFKKYVNSNYDPALRALVNQAVMGLKKQNLSNSTKIVLRNVFLSSQQAYQTCKNSLTPTVALEKIQWYQKMITEDQNEADSFGTVIHANVSNLTQILNGAQATIVQPLQSQVASAKNATQIQEAIDSYCIEGGCENGINYHLSAKLTISKLNILLSELRASQSNTTQISNAQANLNNADAELKSAGTSKYSMTQSVYIWWNINAAKVAIRSLISSLRNA